jgi:Pyruvate/2-oxoacid:ferredoxin oxidoreductase delta subunit
MCPVPEKAIYLEESKFTIHDGEEIVVQLPNIDRDLCIGCGICENKCPLTGEAAIRVFDSEEAVFLVV